MWHFLSIWMLSHYFSTILMSSTPSLSALIGTHARARERRRGQLDAMRRSAVLAVDALSSDVTGRVVQGFQSVQHNQKRLEEQTKVLQTEADKFAKQTGKWLKLYKQLNTALLELGDVRDWAKGMQNDLNDVGDVLREMVQHETAYRQQQEAERAQRAERERQRRAQEQAARKQKAAAAAAAKSTKSDPSQNASKTAANHDDKSHQTQHKKPNLRQRQPQHQKGGARRHSHRDDDHDDDDGLP